AEEVSKFGLITAKIKNFAAPVVRIGEKILPVLRNPMVRLGMEGAGAILAIYDVYDQATELSKALASEDISELSQIPDAITGIVGHVESIAQEERARDIATTNEILKQKELANKLVGARNFALGLKAKLQFYGSSRNRENIHHDSWWDAA